MADVIYEIYGEDAHEMTYALLTAANAADRIPDGAGVALKPNLVLAASADNGAITHPGVLSGCIAYLKDHGIHDISIMESSWVGAQTDSSFHVSGYDRVCEEYGVPFYDLKKDRVVVVDTPFRPMELCRRAYEADFLIDLPVLKGHCQTRMTCALKNLKGCIPDREKRRFHSEGLFQPIAALAAVLKPDLVIVDSICGDLDFEEGGNPIRTNRMYLGWDALLVDAYGASLMGLGVDEIGYLRLAEEWGAGSMDIASTKITRLNKPQESNSYPSRSAIVDRLTGNVLAKSACSACFASLVRALYILESRGKRYDGSIAIGQEWQGVPFEGLGVGRCAGGAACPVKGCPPSAQDIIKAIAAIHDHTREQI